MHRLFWLMVGMGLGAWGYRYMREQGGELAGLEPLGESGRRLTDRSRAFADASKQLMEAGRQLAEESRQFAQSAAATAQTRGQELAQTVKSRAGVIQDDAATAPQRDEVRDATAGQ